LLLHTSITTSVADWVPSFPSAELVHIAAGLFSRETIPTRTISIAPAGVVAPGGNLHPWAAKAAELFGRDRVGITEDQESVEGPRWRVEIGPGVVSVRNKDYVRAYRAQERELAARQAAVAAAVARLEAGLDPDDTEARGRVVRVWSDRSRARMVIRLAELDYNDFTGPGQVPAMITLTYPGDWLAVAPSARIARGHVDALRKRLERRWGVDLAGVWKREFQDRGAPHFHILMVPPRDPEFRAWLSIAWAEIVAAAWCGRACWETASCCERGRHVKAGTGIDYTNGARALDPVRLAQYFAKHGSYSEKEYQNEAPREWLHEPECPSWHGETTHDCEGCAWEGVGRFWGYWRIERSVAAVEIAEDVALALVRTMRRAANAKRFYSRRKVWRKVTTVDRESGEIGFKWRRRTVLVPVRRMRGVAGSLLVNDGPAFASQLAVVARQATSTRRTTRSGAGPVGFLP